MSRTANQRHFHPAALRPRLRDLPGWETSADALFDWLRARMTHDALSAIAEADHGCDAEAHLAELTRVCVIGTMPRVFDWVPHEVLALVRWSEGDSVDHLQRAFCCLLLCLSPGDELVDELATSGAILAESCLVLGPAATDLAERFFAWCAETAPVNPDYFHPDTAIATLLLFLLRAASDPTDPRLDPLAATLTSYDYLDLGVGKRAIAQSMQKKLWRTLFARILQPIEASVPAAASVLHSWAPSKARE